MSQKYWSTMDFVLVWVLLFHTLILEKKISQGYIIL